ncbi:MBL fold metallo-hydrolase [Heyndrickxia acidicola]|uniref:MBL fold metallo-hydrolase n=1 Tax=Heyndrickxia acidicola TaxID=209389 RepID=A0ABU6MLG5_9BACI|nr:MBL fold metallo-hydrolase [Heyndrickxia acidicola]MED1205139.1 MBL fold metallo-hydrolase [Heyndrickxia acidicola]
MHWRQIPLGILQTNCYLLYNEKKDCVIFDPGAEGKKLLSFLKKERFNPLAILLTHAHFDHIGAVDEIRDEYQIPVYVHKKEAGWLGNSAVNGSAHFVPNHPVTAKPADKFISEEGVFEVGPFSLEVFETPGHSPGSVSYYSKELEVVFAGDTLFKEGIGRTDLVDGNAEQLLRSIHDKLLSLPEETYVLPGHGPVTTVQDEMDGNPFLNGY